MLRTRFKLIIIFQIDVTEEYFLYGMDSFIADVGGFLGLLLGASLLSLVEDLLEICGDRCSKKQVQEYPSDKPNTEL